MYYFEYLNEKHIFSAHCNETLYWFWIKYKEMQLFNVDKFYKELFWNARFSLYFEKGNDLDLLTTGNTRMNSARYLAIFYLEYLDNQIDLKNKFGMILFV